MSHIKRVGQTKPGDLPLIILQKMHLGVKNEKRPHQFIILLSTANQPTRRRT